MSMMFPLTWIFLGAVAASIVERAEKECTWLSFASFAAVGMLAGWLGGVWSGRFLEKEYTILCACGAALASSALLLMIRKLQR